MKKSRGIAPINLFTVGIRHRKGEPLQYAALQKQGQDLPWGRGTRWVSGWISWAAKDFQLFATDLDYCGWLGLHLCGQFFCFYQLVSAGSDIQGKPLRIYTLKEFKNLMK